MQQFWAKTTKSEYGRIYKITQPAPFSSGYNRYAFKAKIVEGINKGQKAVVKIFKNKELKNKIELLKADATVSRIARQYADSFSKKLGDQKLLKFRASEIVKIEKVYHNSNYFSPGDTVAAERYIEPQFSHWTNCFGDQFISTTTLSAFEHYVFVKSHGKRMICDLQGGKKNGRYELTDPTMSSTIDSGINLNKGEQAIKKVMSRHHCNQICEKLGL